MNRVFLSTRQLCMFLLLFFSAAVYGQIQPNGTLFLKINPPLDNPILQAEEILQKAYSQELSSDGYNLVSLESQADLVMSITYRTLGRTMYYDVVLIDRSTEEPIVSRSYEVDINARLKQNLQSHISKLIQELHMVPAPTPPAAVSENSGNTSDTGDTGNSDNQREGSSNSTSRENGASETDTGEDETAGQTKPSGKMPEKEPRKLSLAGSLSAGLFIPLGEIVSYASSGYAASGFIGYNLGTSDIGIAAGLSAGLISFRATGLASETDVTLIPFGACLRIAASGEPTLTPVWYLQGGAAGMLYSTETSGRQQKFIPFVSSGLGLNARILKVAGLEFRIDFSVFLESGLTILGISPIIGVSL